MSRLWKEYEEQHETGAPSTDVSYGRKGKGVHLKSILHELRYALLV